MAILFWTRRQIRDAAGVAVNGGKLRIYVANTTTLASTYSDIGMTTPLTNPVVADSLGYLPAIYLSDSSNYDLAELSAGDVLLRATDDIPALGSDTSTLIKDFTNSRFQVRGSGGTVYVEAGDASPDNSGGVGRLGGWAGTQADSWTADAAIFNTTAWLKERGKKLLGIVQTEATTFTSAATVDIPLTENVDGVRAWEVWVFDLQFPASSTGNLYGLLSYDGGSTFKSGAGDYHPYVRYGTSETGAAASAFMEFTVSAETTSTKPGLVKFSIVSVESGTGATVIGSVAHMMNNGATSPTVHDATNYGLGGYGRATHLRLYSSNSGGGETLTGKYRVAPLYGFGET